MNRNRSSTRSQSLWIPIGLCLICAILIKPVQDRLEARLGGSGQIPDLLYFNSPSLIKKMALGYDSFLADIYWVRTIQYYGRTDKAAKRLGRYKNLATLFDITTTLDPDLMDAYSFGSYIIAADDPIGAAQPLEALKLLNKGIRTHPQNFKLFRDKGFIHFWFRQDFQSAGETWLEGSRVHGAPFYMENLSAMAFSKSDAMDAAKFLWQRQYQESDRANVKENALNNLNSLQVAEDLWTLEFLIEKYKATFKSYPGSLQDLVYAGFVKSIPADPLGTPYQYNSRYGFVELAPDSKVRYLKVPDSYKEIYRKKLISIFGTPYRSISNDD